MKIAVISDIHANLPALEATLDDIGKRKVDKIICLGDLIGKGPSSKAVIDICRENCDLIVQGNWDYFLYRDYCALRDGEDKDVSERVRWYINDAGSQRIEYLGSLPHSTELHLSGKLIRLFHAHPLNFNRYYSTSPLEQRLELFDYGKNSSINKVSDVAIYADIHGAYMQTVSGKILINVGSVGNPLDITQSSYIILEGEENSYDESCFNIQFIRVPYDIARAISIAKTASVPDLEGYISELTTATYFRRS